VIGVGLEATVESISGSFQGGMITDILLETYKEFSHVRNGNATIMVNKKALGNLPSSVTVNGKACDVVKPESVAYKPKSKPPNNQPAKKFDPKPKNSTSQQITQLSILQRAKAQGGQGQLAPSNFPMKQAAEPPKPIEPQRRHG